MPFLRSFASVVLVATTVLASRRVEAQPVVEQLRLPVAIETVTVASCPSERFQRELESRVRRPFVVRAGAEAKLRVTITLAGEVLEGSAAFAGASGRAERSVRGTCDEITSALALVATTWLEAEPVPDTPPAPSAALPSPAPSPIAASPSAAVESRSRELSPRKHFSLGAQGIATFGLVGGPAGGAAISLAYETERIELRGGLRGALGGETIPAGRARYAWLTVPFDACLHALTGRVFRLAGCARVEPGYFHTTFAASGSDLPWLALGAGARFGWSIMPVRIEVEAFGTVPASGYRISPAGATLVPFPAFAPAIAAGIMVPFS